MVPKPTEGGNGFFIQHRASGDEMGGKLLIFMTFFVPPRTSVNGQA